MLGFIEEWRVVSETETKASRTTTTTNGLSQLVTVTPLSMAKRIFGATRRPNGVLLAIRGSGKKKRNERYTAPPMAK